MLMDRHGLRTLEHNNWILVDGELPAIRASWFASDLGPDDPDLDVLIQVILPDGRIIEDRHVGIGPTWEAAFANGMLMFCTTTLHVLMAAFWGRLEADQVLVEDWSIRDRKWRAFIGNIGRRMSEGGDVPVPEGFFRAVERQAKGLALTHDLNWISAYHAHIGNARSESSFLVNNASYGPAGEAIARVDWPPAGEFYSARNFLILKAG